MLEGSTRRRILTGGSAAVLAAGFPFGTRAFADGTDGTAAGTGAAAGTLPDAVRNTPGDDPGRLGGRFRALERTHSARLGVYAWDTATGSAVLHRADELFPMCSTFKTAAVAAVLRDLDRDGEFLASRIRYTESDVARSGYAPVTGLPENVARGMTVSDLCAAAIAHSDNTAANLLLRALGGPHAVTRFCRSLGDGVTRLDRWEPDLNSAEPGRVTDTTGPRAIGRTYARLVLGEALPHADRARLTEWLRSNATGDRRLRAGLPKGWTVAEKTGTGSYGTANDVGVAWPSDGSPPVVMAVLTTKPVDATAPADEPLIAETAALLVSALRG
jgi:beta-lactamase class A